MILLTMPQGRDKLLINFDHVEQVRPTNRNGGERGPQGTFITFYSQDHTIVMETPEEIAVMLGLGVNHAGATTDDH